MYALVKPRGMWTGLIIGQRIRQAERGTHEDRVLVGRLAVDDRVSLADRLGEADVQAAVVQCGQQPQRDGGLAAVHAGRGEIELPHGSRLCGSRALRRRHIPVTADRRGSSKLTTGR